MKTNEELARKLSKAFEKTEAFIAGTVMSVDSMGAFATIEPFNSLMPEIDVRLCNEDGGYIIIPTIGSVIMAVEANPSDWICCFYGAISEVRIKNEGYSITMDQRGITMNDGVNEGVPLVLPLVARLAALEGYMNTIQVQYANLLTQLSTTYLPPLAATVAAAALPPVAFVPATLADLANPVVKQ